MLSKNITGIHNNSPFEIFLVSLTVELFINHFRDAIFQKETGFGARRRSRHKGVAGCREGCDPNQWHTVHHGWFSVFTSKYDGSREDSPNASVSSLRRNCKMILMADRHKRKVVSRRQPPGVGGTLCSIVIDVAASSVFSGGHV